MSSSSKNEPQVTTQQPDPDMKQMSPEHDIESLTPEATQAIATEKVVPLPPTVKPQQRTNVIQPRSSQSNSRSSKPQVGEKIQKTQKEDIVEHVDASENDDHLAQLDWTELEHRYRAALIEANNTEDALNDKFDSYADAFQIWSQVSAHQDNERAQKRLKTRIAYVQLSEKDFENKKRNYAEVVQAFKTALDLLRKSNPMSMAMR